jgi:hypothetical protein
MSIRVELAPGKSEREYVTIPSADIVERLRRVLVGEFASIVIEASDAEELLKRLQPELRLTA